MKYKQDTFHQTTRYFVLSAGIIIIIFFADKLLNIPSETLTSWGLLCVAFILTKMESFKNTPGRLFFIFVAVLITTRYFFWRTFETLIYTGPLDVIGMSLIYSAECYAITIHMLGMFINVLPLNRTPLPLPDNPSDLPTIDVFIPTYNESEEIIRLTVTAATHIDYPKEKISIHILDDGGTFAKRNSQETSRAAWERYYSLQRMASELGVNYITRTDNSHAKAGNLNNALKSTSGDIILFLDCDHVPTRDILKNTVGFFINDVKLFLVQMPHYFINPTTVEKNIGSFSSAPGENDMFYQVIQRGMDFWNASYFCGSAALMRRKYLLESGGIAGETITEDAETALHLHNRGYNSAYIGKPMICGLSPETFDRYIIQRTRWAEGMAQIFILKNPLLAKGMTIPQRLCYFNSCFFWFFGIARIIFYMGPALFLILGLNVYHASVSQVLVYALPHVISTFVVMAFFYGKFRRPFFSEIYESVQSIFITPAVISTMLNPRKPSFKITPKGGEIKDEFINPHATSFFIIALINLVAIPLAIYKWFYFPLFRSVVIITFCWCAYNLILAIITLGAFWERGQARHYHRARVKGGVDVFFPRLNQAIKGDIKDISLTGIGIEIAPPFPIAQDSEHVLINASDSYGDKYEFGGIVKTFNKRDENIICGIEFKFEQDTYSQLVRFVYGDSKRWQDILEERTKPAGASTRDMYYFLYRGVKGSVDRFIYIDKLIVLWLKNHILRLFPQTGKHSAMRWQEPTPATTCRKEKNS